MQHACQLTSASPLYESMTTPTLEYVQAYYDERVEGKLRDFTDSNPRIEAAVQLVAEWAPPNPRRILEIGCGIGATSWRMSRAWPDAEVVGADVSATSIEVAKTCFRRTNLSYRCGLIEEGALAGKFDLILLMDTYEHIAIQDRPPLHSAIRSLLAQEARVIVTVPTPAILADARAKDLSTLQPVDEDVRPTDILVLAEATATQLLYYREVGVWHYGDYAHIALGRYRNLADVALRQFRPRGIAALRQRFIGSLFGREPSDGCRDYLGTDLLRPSVGRLDYRFRVTTKERKRLVSSWLSKELGEETRICP